MYKLFHNLYIGTSGMPSPTAILETFVFNFVGDGFLHVPNVADISTNPRETSLSIHHATL